MVSIRQFELRKRSSTCGGSILARSLGFQQVLLLVWTFSISTQVRMAIFGSKLKGTDCLRRGNTALDRTAVYTFYLGTAMECEIRLAGLQKVSMFAVKVASSYGGQRLGCRSEITMCF